MNWLSAKYAGRMGILYLLLFPTSVIVGQEIEEADLVEIQLGEAQTEAGDLEQLENLFAAAQEVFASAEQLDSILLFTELIDLLQSRSEQAPLSADEKRLLSGSLFSRGEANFNLGNSGLTEADLRQAITIDPAMPIDLNRLGSILWSGNSGSGRREESGVDQARLRKHRFGCRGCSRYSV
jgi:hypothetical protein